MPAEEEDQGRDQAKRWKWLRLFVRWKEFWLLKSAKVNFYRSAIAGARRVARKTGAGSEKRRIYWRQRPLRR